MEIDRVLFPEDCLLPVLPDFWKAPEGFQTPSDRKSRKTTSRSSRWTPEEDWCPIPDQNFDPSGHWEYDFSRIPHRNVLGGPELVREPLEHEWRWVPRGPPSPIERCVEEPQPLRFADLWNSPPPFEGGNTFSGSSPALERLQVQHQTPTWGTTPQLPIKGPPPVRRTGHAWQQRQLPDNVYGSNPVGTEILTDAAWENLLQDPNPGVATLLWPGRVM